MSCASAAMAAAALLPQQAHAQAAPGAFQGTPGGEGANIASIGSASRTTGTGTETITVDTGKAVIDWSPFDTAQGPGSIDFLPAGNVATFVNGANTTDYTVLNRINPVDPSRPIALNGTVISKIQNGEATGGNVWFYSPGGILVGPTAVFDVGGLLLTSAAIPDLDDNGSPDFDGTGTSFSFRGLGATPGSKIEVQSGADINASNYVALVAPRVEQGGTVRTASAAYVAAESLTMNMNQGLFDIQVDIGGGTDDGNGVVHTGSTLWPVDAAGTPRVYMVAVPKNQAIEMLLGGTVGFEAAGAAAFDNGAIVLSAGGSVKEIGQPRSYSALSGTDASLTINPGTYRGHVDSSVNGNIQVLADEGSIEFGGNVNLHSQNAAANGNITVSASGGNSLTVAGDFTASTINSLFSSFVDIGADGGDMTFSKSFLLSAGPAQDGTATNVDIRASNGSTLSVAEGTQIFANVGAFFPNVEGDSRDNRGGNVGIQTFSNGQILLHALTVDVSANGEANIGNGDLTGGDGTGGSVNISSNDGGLIDINGALTVSADGIGGDIQGTDFVNPSFGGQGEGGTIGIHASDADVTIHGAALLKAIGSGGDYTGEALFPGSVTGGRGEGGSIFTWVDGGGTITYVGTASLNANGTGGSAVTGGGGQGGSAGFSGYFGTINIGPSVTIDAIGRGGDANVAFGGTGGRGDGGVGFVEARALLADTTEIVVLANSTINGGNVAIDASGIGGKGGASNGDNIAAGTGGVGAGGFYEDEVLGSGGAFAGALFGSTLHLGNVTLKANGTGGAGGDGSGIMGGGAGGAAFGGTTELGAYGPLGFANIATFANVTLDSSAFGGSGGTGGIGQGIGGAAVGGEFVDDPQTLEIEALGGAYIDAIGNVTIGNALLLTQALGGNGSTGGAARGGTAQAAAWQNSDSLLTFTGGLRLDSSGIGGNGIVGGSGRGGYAGLGSLIGATVDITGDLTLDAVGQGGFGQNGGGTGTGGTNELLADGGSIDLANFFSNVRGWGGNSDGTGGFGHGGFSTMGVNNGGSITTGFFDIAAIGLGGIGGNGLTGSDGGDALGGDVTLNVADGLLTAGAMTVNVRGLGGDGGAGSTGAGGNGGDAQGGTNGFTVGTTGVVQATSYNETANGIGGNGGDGVTTDGLGGAAQGGTNSATFGGSTHFTDNFLMTAFALGGDGGTGGDAGGGSTSVIVNGSLIADSRVQSTGQAQGGNSSDGSGSGGSASGGTGNLEVNGTLQTGSIFVGAASTGGNGASGGSGNGFAAEAQLTVAGSLTVDSILIDSHSTGGNGVSAGGDGFAGRSTLDIASGAIVHLGSDTEITSDGFGGNATNGFGGIGQGTWAQITTQGNLTATGVTFVSAEGEGGDGSSGGGDGFGGDAGISTTNAGTTVLGAMTNIEAEGTGGGSSGGAGGDGWGGHAILSALEGSIVSANNVTVNVSGGGGFGVTGGNGFGGDSGVETFNQAAVVAIGAGSHITLTGQTFINSAGEGGDGSSGAGGDGFGGLAQLAAFDGGAVTVGSTFVNAGSTGGSGGSGFGIGTGGHALLLASGGSVSGGAMLVAADASQDGGTAEASADNGGDMQLASLVADASGSQIAGQVLVGVAYGSTADLGSASLTSTGGGGAASVEIDVGAGVGSNAGDILFADDITITSDGSIDVLSHNGAGINVTNAFDAIATGTITFDDQSSGALLTVPTLDLTAANIVLDWAFDTTDAFLTVNGDYAVNGLPFASNALTITAAGDLTGGNLVYGSNLVLDAGGGLAMGSINAAGNLDLFATGDIGTGNLAAGGSIFASAGGSLLAQAVSAGGDILLDAFTTLTTGALSAPGNIDLDTFGDIVFGNVTAGDFEFESDASVTGQNIAAVNHVGGEAEGAIQLGDISVSAGVVPPGEFSIGMSSATSIDVGDVSGPGRVGFATLGDFTGGALTGGELAMLLVGGDINVGAITTASTGRVYLADSSMFILGGGGSNTTEFNADIILPLPPVATGGSIAIAGPVSTGRMQAAAGTDFTSGNLTGTGPIELSAGGDLGAGAISSGAAVTLAAGGGLTTSDLDAATAINVAASGNLLVGDASAGQSIALAGGGNAATGSLDAGQTVAVTAGSGLLVGNVDANAATFTAGGLASFLGAVSVPTITVTSSDIDVGAGGSLGVAGVTGLLTLNAVSSGAPVVIGEGAAAPGQYHLGGEAGDIRAATLVVNAANADVHLLDVQIEGSATPGGGNGDVTLNTGGSVFVLGQVDFTDAGAGDSLTINAGDSIQVATDSGGIAITDADGDPAGILALTAHDIWVADQATLDLIAEDPTFANAIDLLSVNNGPVNPEGYLVADALEVTMLGSSFLVQNTGTPDELAGLTVGDGGLSIVNDGSDPATVILFGRQQRNDGTIVTGDAFANDVQLSGPGGFSENSFVNGCDAGGACGEPQPPPVPPEEVPGAESILGPIGLMDSPSDLPFDEGTDDGSGGGDDEADEEEEAADEEGSGNADASVGLINTGPVSIDQPVEEPVTSGSDIPGGGN